MKLLLVEDENALANTLVRGLKEEGFVVDWASDGAKGLFMAQTGSYDLIILDWMLPQKDGLAVLKKLRQDKTDVSVLLLTAKEDLESKIAGLDGGADDYLTKPFQFNELLARIRAILRRPTSYQDEKISVGDLTINTTTKEVQAANELLKLSPKEYSLLEVFVRHLNQVLSREQLIEQVWDHSYDGFSNVVDVYIRYLRNKLKVINSPQIKTIRGFGYKLSLE